MGGAYRLLCIVVEKNAPGGVCNVYPIPERQAGRTRGINPSSPGTFSRKSCISVLTISRHLK
jgi:hypothetical protein